MWLPRSAISMAVVSVIEEGEARPIRKPSNRLSNPIRGGTPQGDRRVEVYYRGLPVQITIRREPNSGVYG